MMIHKNNMKFTNYCVVIMENTKDVLIEIEKVSETKVNVLDGSGILIATFMSSLDPREISDWFKLNNRSFLVFDLHPNNSGFNITKAEIHEGLFGFIKTLNNETLQERADNFLKEVQSNLNIKTNNFSKKEIITINEVKLTKEVIAKMTMKEKEELQNKIIDNGIENMTDNDKEILGILWK